jgi:DedD protein
MERRQKERLIGASVLIMIAVIFIPMVLDDSVPTSTEITVTNIPPRPPAEFSSRIRPLSPPASAPAVASAEPASTQTTAAATDLPPAAAAGTGPSAGQEPGPVAPGPAGRADSKPSAPKPEPDPSVVGLAAWVVQLGTFADKENAEGLNRKLRAAGYASFVEPLMKGTETAFRVRVGPELRKTDAERTLAQLKSAMGVKEGMVVRYP